MCQSKEANEMPTDAMMAKLMLSQSSIWANASEEGERDDATPNPADHDSEQGRLFLPLIERIPSFIPEQARRIPSLEMLVPEPNSDLRKSSLVGSTFNMIATIIGGGVLSLPFAFREAGIVGGTLLMVLAACITDFSLYILCSCARRTGASSYGGVALCAFGPSMEIATTMTLLTYLLFVLVGYLVLVADICGPVIMILLTGHDTDPNSVFLMGFSARNVILCGLLVCLMPLLLKKDLHSLRHTCYIGFTSICILCVGLAYRAVETNILGAHHTLSEIRLFPDNIKGALYAFPIITLAFLSQFNIISVHCALKDPTRRRVRKVIDNAVSLSFLLMYAFAIAGYLCAFGDTKGNILLNFSSSDRVIFLGRAACGVTMMLVVPLSLLPCREALLELPIQLFSFSPPVKNRRDKEPQDDLQLNEGSPLISVKFKEVSQDAELDIVADKTAWIRSETMHIATTLFIVTLTFFVATTVKGIEVVWGLVGSSLAFFVAYILPAACYIKLRSHRKGLFNKRILMAWTLLVFSMIGACLCTWMNVEKVFFK